MDKQIDEIMEHFDFRKVHKVMTLIGWGYHNEGVPSLQQIMETALDHLNAVSEKDISSRQSGGFKATKINGENGTFLQLEFILTHWDTEK